MLTTFSSGESASDLHYAAAQLFSAAEIMAEVEQSIPGPETLAGFSGIVRFAFDAFVNSRIAMITEAQHGFESAAWSCRGLATDAEPGTMEPGR
ncbi:hypothetical protein [Microcella putealis]|nr:hypothetical protein [Microcella putealis]TQM27299.1 hypothetical protein BJ957_0734 [Microcella putealis]